jgi:hypothetical protein
MGLPFFRFETPRTWKVRSQYIYPYEQEGPVMPPSLGSVFVASYDS